jgi:hypothetical protein
MTSVPPQEKGGHDGDALDPARVETSPTLRNFLSSTSAHCDEAEAARKELRELLDERFGSGLGILVLTGLPTELERARHTVLQASRLIGEPLVQNRDGSFIREVRDRGKAIGEGARGRYSDSRFGGELHTDGGSSPLPVPDIFTLFCVRQSRVGGALQLVHIRDLFHRLADRPQVLETLRAPFHFDRRGLQGPGEPPTAPKPVLFTQNGHQAITYLRVYIEQGHRQTGIPALDAEQRAALDALDAVLDSGDLTRVGKQREGELAFFDNLSLLHGRTEFIDDPVHSRLLLRTWISRGIEAS